MHFLLILKIYINKQTSYQEICDIFIAFNARNSIFKSTIIRTIQRFIETSVNDCPRSEQSKSAFNNEKSTYILQIFIETSNMSTKKVIAENEVD